MKEKIFKAIILEPVHPVLQQVFHQYSIKVIEGYTLSPTELVNELKDTNILIVRSKKVDATFIDLAPQLKIIGRAGSGLENIDVQYAQSKGIVCINSPEGNRDAVGEHAIGMLLMLLNHLKKADTEVRQNIWDRKSNWGTELKGQTVAIIGYGNTGTAFAKKLSGFECTILAYDKYKNEFNEPYVRKASMEEIYEKADIVSLHLPLTLETLYLANVDFFQAFRKNIYFINTARGKIVHTSSLVKALKAGKVKGACLDVIEYEESNFENLNTIQSEDFEYLKNSQNVILTPHIAGWTYQSYEKICRILAEKILEKIHVIN
ncbi:MAG: 2-hydroxyacid dehydrogenase [Bacteroidia bacterium]|nr:MAG: 2-hydroxyacid dehydrogenase [Bacteroidia bacterium]